MTSKDLKEAVGKDIWVIPTGNSVARGGKPLKEQIRKATLEKVGTKTFTFINVENGYNGSFPIDGGLDKNNYGYIPYLTEQDAKNHFIKIELIEEINRLGLNELSLEELNKIKNFIKKEKPKVKYEEDMSLS
jgi:hypothetical protein